MTDEYLDHNLLGLIGAGRKNYLLRMRQKTSISDKNEYSTKIRGMLMNYEATQLLSYQIQLNYGVNLPRKENLQISYNSIEDNDSLPNLYRLVSTILSIQLANAFVERVFSLCKAQWTDARNCLQVETVRALLQVRVNFDCAGVYKLLIKDGELRKKIQGGEKWK